VCGLVVILLFAGAQIRTAQREEARAARLEFLRDSMRVAHVRDSIRAEIVRDSTAEAAARRAKSDSAKAAIKASFEAGQRAAEEQRRRFEAMPRRTRTPPVRDR
jgi:hypothetical protein